MNFVRGVSSADEVGKKVGEEFVCLRESNVPVHTHVMNSDFNPVQDSESSVRLNSGSNDTRIVNQ